MTRHDLAESLRQKLIEECNPEFREMLEQKFAGDHFFDSMVICSLERCNGSYLEEEGDLEAAIHAAVDGSDFLRMIIVLKADHEATDSKHLQALMTMN